LDAEKYASLIPRFYRRDFYFCGKPLPHALRGFETQFEFFSDGIKPPCPCLRGKGGDIHPDAGIILWDTEMVDAP
jgi:hypothetical protein